LRTSPRFHNPFRTGTLAVDVPGVDRFADQPRAVLQNPVGIHLQGDEAGEFARSVLEPLMAGGFEEEPI